MNKKVLILVLSSDWHPYNRLTRCSLETWDNIEVENVETVFYFPYSDKKDTDKMIYLPVSNDLFSMGKKTLLAFEWALINKKFDYISRPQANAFIDKRELIKYAQTLPDENVFDTLEVAASATTPRYGWGCGTLFSHDVIQKIVGNKSLWNHKLMEDVGMSGVIDSLGIPFRKGRACSIDKLPDGTWQCTCYGTESFTFTDFSEIKKAQEDGQYWYRCKQDYDRTQDEYVMKELFKVLQ